MVNYSLVLLLAAAPCVAGEVKGLSTPPKDLPPLLGTAVVTPSSTRGDDGWSITLVVPKVAWKVVGEERPKRNWPRLSVSVEEVTLTLPMAYERASQLSADARFESSSSRTRQDFP
jgi:hypothetical protein